jgi:hypothetical protein
MGCGEATGEFGLWAMRELKNSIKGQQRQVMPILKGIVREYT